MVEENQNRDIEYCFSISRYHHGHKVSESVHPMAPHDAVPEVEFTWQRHAQGDGLTRNICTFQIRQNLPDRSSLGIHFNFKNWSVKNYVFAPAALYNGNRFKSIHKPYPPMLTKEEAQRYRGQTVISDVPRLEEGGGCVQLNVGISPSRAPAIIRRNSPWDISCSLSSAVKSEILA